MRALLELAENYGKGPLNLKKIAEHQDISAKYLEQLMAVFKSKEIVRSIRGPNGGYILARAPSKIKISECFICMEGTVITTRCVDNSSLCPRSTDCDIRELWIEVNEAMMTVLRSKTLQDIIDHTKKTKH